MGWQYSDGDRPNAGAECKGVWKNHYLRPVLGFISELMQDRAIVTMEGYETMKLHPSFQIVPFWMTLSDL